MRSMGTICGIVVLLACSGVAFADSIAPGTFSATLATGGSTTVEKTVTITEEAPTSAKVDVFFLADTTGSMYDEILAVRNSASTILSTTAGLGDVWFGAGEYRDFGDAFTYRVNQDLTGSQAAAQAGIDAWAVAGGGDWAEAQLFALSEMANGQAWRTGSTRIAVWFGDAPGHDPSGGATLASTISALNSESIVVQAVDMGSLDSYGQATDIADATSGDYYPGINSSTIADTISAAISAVFDAYSSVSLGLGGVPSGVTVGVTPAGYTGTYDRSVSRTFTFNVTFTGDSAGTYDFPIYALVDGGIVATETDHIVVGNVVPLPSAAFGGFALLAGLAGVRRLRRRSRA